MFDRQGSLLIFSLYNVLVQLSVISVHIFVLSYGAVW